MGIFQEFQDEYIKIYFFKSWANSMKLNNSTLENSICFTFPQRVRIYNSKFKIILLKRGIVISKPSSKTILKKIISSPTIEI